MQSSNSLLMQRLVNSLKDVALIATDAKLDIQYANPYACELFGLDPEAIKSGHGHLPVTIVKRTWLELRKSNDSFTLQHAVNKKLKTLKIFISNLEDAILDHASPQKLGYVIHVHDITDLQETGSPQQDWGAILDALISCEWLLHSAESWQKVAVSVLELISLATHFGRATLLKNNVVDSGKALNAIMLHEWSSPDFSHKNKPYDTINFKKDGCQRWVDVLRQAEAVYGRREQFEPEEQAFLSKHGSQSIVTIPVFVGNQWWGILLVERDIDLPEISSYELDALMAVGRSFGVVIQRESAGNRLHQAKIAFESAVEGIMITDANTRIIAINRSFTEITGFAEEDVIGTVPNVLNHENHAAEFFREIWDTLAAEGRWRGELWNTRKNGDQYAEWLTLTCVKDEEGEVINYVGVFADISEIKHSQRQLNELVNRDPLTGLPNRRLLNELLDHAIKRAEREKHQIAILFIDLDRFKGINDTLGHHVGDQLLLEVSKRISQSVRESDAVARLGGDEFLVMMDMLRKQDDAEMVARKIINALQAEFIIDGRELFIGASVGISIYPTDSTEVDGLIKSADIAMYHVKSRGKNNLSFYSADLSQHAVERFTLENHLRKALERDQFHIYYQPQVSIRTGRIIGAEALIRWHHPELGVVSPAKFIPLAEETGLIVQIGEWVLRQSAIQAMAWAQAGLELPRLSVNVSGVQIQRSNFADTVYGILIETDCLPSLLELEITESTVMHNTEYVISVFDRIKQLGLRLAIDDFGTGYSSLSHLKRLPLDKIKIDQSFVRELPDNHDDAAIANAIYAMAKSLGFKVIAEGVETIAQAEFLFNMGCEEAQGYLYSRPVDGIEFSKMLAKGNLGESRDAG